ncbi:MAG: TIGR01777 family protein [Chitinophagaceae bacterium]
MQTVLITGGTGFIGRALTKLLLEKNYRVIILTRDLNHQQTKLQPHVQYAQWDLQKQIIDEKAIAASDHIVHLAGANVGEKRWTKKRKKEIVESRTKSGELLVKALKEIPNNVKAVISASGIGWYGPDPVIPNPQPFIESAECHDDFLGETCRLWEEGITPVSALGKRLVILRTGIAISENGGAAERFHKTIRFGIAPILGSGKQVMSWIDLDDLVRLYLFAIENEKVNGIYNAVAPFPVSNRRLVTELAKHMKGSFFIPVYVPSFALRLLIGEMSIEVLKSATVSSEKIRKAGFQFVYPSISASIRKQPA